MIKRILSIFFIALSSCSLLGNLLDDLHHEFHAAIETLATNTPEYHARMTFISDQLKEFSPDEQKEILVGLMGHIVEKYNFNQDFSQEQSIHFARSILEFLEATEQEFPITDDLRSKDDYALQSFPKIAYKIEPLIKNSARSRVEFNEQLTCFFLEHMTNAVRSYMHLEEALSKSSLNDLYVRAIIDLCRLKEALEYNDEQMLYFTIVSGRWYLELRYTFDISLRLNIQKA